MNTGHGTFEYLIIFAVVALISAVLEPLLSMGWHLHWALARPISIIAAYCLLSGFVYLRDFIEHKSKPLKSRDGHHSSGEVEKHQDV